MKNEQILSAIDNFIANRLYHYALMINGSWGCGKTYFTNEVLIPYLRKERKLDVNYISLYGIKDPDEIANKLCERAIRDKITQKTGKNTEGRGAQIAGLVISKLLKYGIRKVDIDTSDLDGISEILPNYDNNVIIFDDLERCQCDVCAVLGYINDFVEHSDASVIIIANEDEIGKGNLEENQELQMLVALNKRLNLHLPATSFSEIMDEQRGRRKDVPKEYLTPDEVHRARKLIFQSGEHYRRTKEKVIGLTLDYVPDLMEVFSKLISENIKEEPLKERLLNAVGAYVHLAERENHRNIRSFLFFLEKMKQIYYVTPEDAHPAIQMVAYYCYRSTISRMKGEKAPVWEDKEYGTQTFGMGVSLEDYPYGFRFVDELITSNSIDPEKIAETLTSYCRIEIAKGSLEKDPYQKLRTWYELDDKELQDVLHRINQNIIDGKYSTCIFSDIVHYLIYFKRDNLFPELCDQIIESMKEFIKKAPKEKIEPFANERYILEGEDLKNYNIVMKEITSCIDETAIITEEEYWKSLIKKKNWAEELSKGLGSREGGLRSFVFWLEPKDLYELIKQSSNIEIFEFRQALYEVYRSGHYYKYQKEDLPHLKELNQLLNDTNGMGQIQAIHCGWIQNDLRELIARFEPNEEVTAESENET